MPAPAPAQRAGPTLHELLQRELGGEIAVEKEIARGRLTVSFLGDEARTGHKVVIKVVPPELKRGAWTERFLRAARTAASLHHPDIVPIHRVAAGDRLCWYVSRYVEGESLEALLERECQLPVERAVDITSRIAAALTYAHEHGVVHGGLTPSRVLLGAHGLVAVRDFGIARASQGAPTPDGAGPIGAAPHYLSPELCAGSAATGTSDQYVLALIAYQMLAGALPFIGTSDEEVMRQQRVEPVPPIALSRSDLPLALPKALERALAKHPDKRFATVARFASALRLATRESQAGAVPPSAGARRSADTLLMMPGGPSTPLLPTLPALPAFARSLRPRRLSMPAHLDLRMLAGAAVLGAVIYLASRAGRGPETASTSREREWVAAAARPASAPETSAPASATPSDAASPAPSEPARDSSPAAATSESSPPPVAPRVSARPTARPASHRQPERRTARAERGSTSRGEAYITVGTNPQAVIFVNGQAMTQNPVRNFPVRSGSVVLRFQVLDTATGVWERDTVITVSPGDTLNLHRVRLVRPQ